MIAFAASVIVALMGNVAILVYSKRRAPGRYLTWGEAMLAATFAFLLFTLWYGVVPHQWITLADNEWGWRSDRILFGPFDVLQPNRFVPFTISYQVLRDIVVTMIYGLALSLHVFHWVHWQNRSKPKPEIVPTTTYGRPLARKA